MFVITGILVIFVRYNRDISLVSYAKPNQLMDVVRYNREFVITVIVITEFDCIQILINIFKATISFQSKILLIFGI